MLSQSVLSSLHSHQQHLETIRLRREHRPRRHLQTHRCAFCLKPTQQFVCCETCDEWYWRLCPTLSGDLYRPPKSNGNIEHGNGKVSSLE